nr:acylphosphatase [Lysobacter sp. CAU 1642]
MVSGRVQGVGFRAATRDEAQALGLQGEAVNLADGRVEVLAEGAAAALDALQAWLHRGPVPASVERVEVAPAAVSGRRGFRIG